MKTSIHTHYKNSKKWVQMELTSIKERPCSTNRQKTFLSMVKSESISSKIRNKIGMSTLTTIIKNSFGSLSHTNELSKRKNKKRTRIRKEGKLSLFADASSELPELINIYGKAAGYTINTPKSLAFLN